MITLTMTKLNYKKNQSKHFLVKMQRECEGENLKILPEMLKNM